MSALRPDASSLRPGASTLRPDLLPPAPSIAAGTLSRRRVALAGLAALLVAVCLLSLSVGAVAIQHPRVLSILGAHLGFDLPWPFAARDEMVLLAVRLPRIVLAGLVGAAVAVSGAVLQGLFRNPLADAGLIGVSSGAAVGAVTVIAFGSAIAATTTATSGPLVLMLGAFAGGLVTVVAVYRVATVDGRTSVATMLLAGIAVNALAGAATGLFVYASDDQQLRDFMFWMLGSLTGATWRELLWGGPLLLFGIATMPRLARGLNALLLGQAEAEHLGIDVARLKRAVVGLAAVTVGIAVALSGIIGFVGLVTPHLLRLAFGPDHRLLLPGSALLGAALLILADLGARTVVAPAELPVGIVTAFIGAPFFFWLLVRDRRRGGAGGLV